MLNRILCVVGMLTSVAYGQQEVKQEVKLTPRDQYESIPTRQEEEMARAASIQTKGKRSG